MNNKRLAASPDPFTGAAVPEKAAYYRFTLPLPDHHSVYHARCRREQYTYPCMNDR